MEDRVGFHLSFRRLPFSPRPQQVANVLRVTRPSFGIRKSLSRNTQIAKAQNRLARKYALADPRVPTEPFIFRYCHKLYRTAWHVNRSVFS